MSRPHLSSTKRPISSDSPDDVKSSTFRFSHQPTVATLSESHLNLSIINTNDVLPELRCPLLESDFNNKENIPNIRDVSPRGPGCQPRERFDRPLHLTLRPRYGLSDVCSLDGIPFGYPPPKTPTDDGAASLVRRRPESQAQVLAPMKNRDPMRRNTWIALPSLPMLKDFEVRVSNHPLLRPKPTLLQEQAVPIDLRPLFDIEAETERQVPVPKHKLKRMVSSLSRGGTESIAPACLPRHSDNSPFEINDFDEFSSFDLAILQSLGSGGTDQGEHVEVNINGEPPHQSNTCRIEESNDSVVSDVPTKKPRLSYSPDRFVVFPPIACNKKKSQVPNGVLFTTPTKENLKKDGSFSCSVAGAADHDDFGIILSTPPTKFNNTLDPPPIVRNTSFGEPPLIRRITTGSSVEMGYRKRSVDGKDTDEDLGIVLPLGY
eukprot:CAMPEP_0202445232 /NCGR_PEP_ID=MMETSP1360-20130828/4091_1 /ASSEMBLY_ACC=CAM_ASM_000848 /TAXON_ID=515479 /ORGANISM="Licmophora paradoxa, Strain CCMP2313" /LENGTH=432 /DNA_ID=CAMNT_0049061417 /DNA_START=124 /DNA_END=1422 /DNA_ORIENTATION=+